MTAGGNQMKTDAELGPAVGLVLPWWIEDWNHRSGEEVGGELGYTTIGVTYFARFDYVSANLPTRRRPDWHVYQRSEIGVAGVDAENDDQFILLPDVVRTTFPAASSSTELKDELARHLRDVLVNSYGEEEHVVERHIARMNEQLRPAPVVVNETPLEGWQADELPHVLVLGAVANHGRLVSVVIDRTIASSLSLRLEDYPSSLT